MNDFPRRKRKAGELRLDQIGARVRLPWSACSRLGDRAGQFGHRVTPVWTTKADTAEVGARAYGAEFDLRRATAKMSAPPGSTHRRRGAPAISLFDDQGAQSSRRKAIQRVVRCQPTLDAAQTAMIANGFVRIRRWRPGLQISPRDEVARRQRQHLSPGRGRHRFSVLAKIRPKRRAPLSDALLADHDPTRRQDQLDITEAQAEAVIARTENHPARLCEAGHGSLWRPSGGPGGPGRRDYLPNRGIRQGRQAAVIANWHRRSHSKSSKSSQPRGHRRRHVLQRLAQIAGLPAMNQPHVQ